jgi:hypothetical protein
MTCFRSAPPAISCVAQPPFERTEMGPLFASLTLPDDDDYDDDLDDDLEDEDGDEDDDEDDDEAEGGYRLAPRHAAWARPMNPDSTGKFHSEG